jgi:hypothetical protein
VSITKLVLLSRHFPFHLFTNAWATEGFTASSTKVVFADFSLRSVGHGVVITDSH